MKRTVRKKIIARRRELGLSIMEVCRLAELSYQTVIGIEKGYDTQTNPSLPTIARLARALQMDMKELL